MKIQLFGGFSVRRNGVPVEMPGKKGRVLAAYLAVRHPVGATRDELIDVIWPDDHPRDPRANLRTLLSRTRDALGHEVLTSVPLIALDDACIETDLGEVRADIAAARADREARRPQQAVERARAAARVLDLGLLRGMEGPWIGPVRQRFEDDLSDMLCCIADMGSLIGGRVGEEAVAAAKELVERDGYLERGHFHLILALARAGEQAEALRAYEEVRRTLRDELGTSPGHELQALHAAILNEEDLGMDTGRSANSPPTPAEIPLPAAMRGAESHTFVGREAELAMIGSHIAADTCGVIAVTGEPGIGKSTVVRRAAAAARDGGAVVLLGNCDDPLAAPYQPFGEALGHLIDSVDSTQLVGQILGPLKSDLDHLLTAVRHRADEPRAAAPEGGRSRLVDAVTAVIDRLSKVAPVVIVLEDLHCSDGPTRRLLRHLERAVRGRPVTFLITFRTLAASESGPLSELLSDLMRDRPIEYVALEGFDLAEVEEYCHLQVSGRVPARLARVLRMQSSGNPLLVRELLRDLVLRKDATGEWLIPHERSGHQVPATVRRLVAGRIAGLSAVDRQLLVRAATLGRIVHPAELAAAAEVSVDRALAVLDATTRLGLVAVADDEPGAFSFDHPVLRDALIAGVTPATRARTHLENAVRLERHWRDDLDSHTLELARHRLAAAEGGLERGEALEWVVRSAAAAAREADHDVAASLYARGLSLLPDSSASRRRQADLLLELAAAQWRCGRRQESRDTRREAFVIASQLDDPDLMASAALGYERYFELDLGETDERAMTVEALAAGPCPRLRIRLRSKLILLDHWTGDPRRTKAQAADEIAAARELGDDEALADALNAALFACRVPDHPIDERMATAAELIEVARRIGSNDRRLEGEAHRLVAIIESGAAAEIRGAVERFGRIAQGARQPFWLFYQHAWAAALAFAEGDLERSEDLDEVATSAATGARADVAVGVAAVTVQRAIEQGGATWVAGQAADLAAKGQHEGLWQAMTAMALGMSGKDDEARSMLRELVRPEGVRLPRDLLWATATCILADVAIEIGDSESAALIARELEPTPRWIAASGRTMLLVSHRLGGLARVMGDHDRSLAHFAVARQQGRDLSAGLLVAWADQEAAATLLERGGPGDVARAQHLVDSIKRFARGRGLRLLEDRIGDLEDRIGAS